MIRTIQRGESLVTSISPRLPGEIIRAAMKPAGVAFSVPDARTPEALVLAVEETTIDGQPAWLLSISSAASQTLTPGSYVMDARITLPNGQVQITDPVQIVVAESVTGP